MPPSPAMRCSPGRELRAENHKRGRSLESGIHLREKDDDLALFNEVQTRERDNFLLQSNDDLDDLFSTKLRYFSDYKLGVSIPARGESSDLLNVEGDKNDYDWLLTPPDTPLFPSLDDESHETPPTNLEQRGRPRSQPISISRSSTMDKSYRSSRGSASPNRLSPSPKSSYTANQSRGRPSSAPHSSPPPNLRHSTPTRKLSPSPNKISTPPPRSSTPTPRRMSTGSSGTAAPSRVRGTSPVKTGRGNSASPKIRAWQSNIPGFSLEAPPNLRTSLGDRPASYVRGSSPASRSGTRSGRQSMSPTATRSVSSSHSHERDHFSSHSKGSVASSGDDDIDSLQSIPVSSSDRSGLRSINGFQSKKALGFSKKPTRVVSSSSAPKRSFDMAIRQMDQRKAPQNMFRPLMSSVPSSTFYAGKAGGAHRSMISRNSSITTSSNASSDQATTALHDTEGSEQNQEDIGNGQVKTTYADLQEEVFVLDKADATNEALRKQIYDGASCSPLGELDGDLMVDSQLVGYEIGSPHDKAVEITADLEVLNSNVNVTHMNALEDAVQCCRCGQWYSDTETIDGDLKLCSDCRSSEVQLLGENSPETLTAILEDRLVDGFVPAGDSHDSSEATGKNILGDCHTRLSPDAGEKSFINPHVDEGMQALANYQAMAQSPNANISSEPDLTAEIPEGAGISVLLNRSSSGKGKIVQNRTLYATNINYDDLSYVRDTVNSLRSSTGYGSASASSSIDLGSTGQTESRFQRQLSGRKLDLENYRNQGDRKLQSSNSSLSGTSSHAVQTLSITTSSLEEFSETSASAHLQKNVDREEQLLHGENAKVNNFCTDVESDDNCRISSKSVDPTGSVPSSANFDESTSSLNGENLANNSDNSVKVEPCCLISETHPIEEDVSNSCVDKVEVVASLNQSSLDAISELEIENGHVGSPDSQSDICSFHSESSIDELNEQSLHTASGDGNEIVATVEKSESMDHKDSILEESTVTLEGQGGNKARSLTLEEATDTILFCSSIVHDLAYRAANIAIENENSVLFEDSRPTVTIVGKANSDRRDLRGRTSGRRNSKSSLKARQKIDTDTKSPRNDTNAESDEKTDKSTTRIVGAPIKGDSLNPPKLESKCNCTIM
ncbi:PREDICTED: uncharacterized protein LOC109211029 [Nicotiana attenuata]|uniref:Uncharacterized protein n=1 Tax=Nicotiana attenuata TaxID=49451 RepID=A0A314KKC0_NICAT|nr:PREDICTED: uncharacterized protein LOC109211029 [Nicotiana attenuata]XP_019230068.1 PREDICTED: uncharacterized protein LOC109211029 [Nicotiana attenuata]OIT29680.1 hypothetical protein A4A49_16731 [Nicotiana attenuata]